MTDFTSLLQPDRGQPAHSLHLLRPDALADWLSGMAEPARSAVAHARFNSKAGEFVALPGKAAEDWAFAIGLGDEPIGPWSLASAANRLPEGSYRLAEGDAGPAVLGWLLAHHRFDRYRAEVDPIPARVLLTSAPARIDGDIRLAEGVAMVRDMIDTPAADMGPAELAAATQAVAGKFGASVTVTQGDALAEGYPMIAAVGRAASRDRAPRLIELVWGDPAHPPIAIVGKGVCFDSGGLDIKPASAMLWMKKDMGGAAHALALARLVMGANLPVRLHLLIPAVENAVSGDAFRPGDVLRSRAGISVEIGNTDAEGRLVLADALTRACEEQPTLIVDFATLTGAARVALGPDLPALFCNDEALATEIAAAAETASDPLWRLPLWQGYRPMLKSTVADMNNSAEGGMAGAITAALFMERFVAKGVSWAHLDTFAWRSATKPGRPKGGDALGLRAIWETLRLRFG